MKILRKNELKRYPGGEIVEKGLSDISKGVFKSIEALAVFIALPRLNDLGFSIKRKGIENPNLVLYEKLCSAYGEDAHYRYNAIMSRINKFCNNFS